MRSVAARSGRKTSATSAFRSNTGPTRGRGGSVGIPRLPPRLNRVFGVSHDDHLTPRLRFAMNPTMAGLIGWGRDVSLTRQFGILSLVVVGLITTTFCLVISRSLNHALLDREWSTTADFIGTEAIHNLKAADFAQPEGPGAQERFLTFYRRAVVMPEIVRLKIYDAAMRIVWSDEPRLIGQVFHDNAELK